MCESAQAQVEIRRMVGYSPVRHCSASGALEVVVMLTFLNQLMNDLSKEKPYNTGMGNIRPSKSMSPSQRDWIYHLCIGPLIDEILAAVHYLLGI